MNSLTPKRWMVARQAISRDALVRGDLDKDDVFFHRLFQKRYMYRYVMHGSFDRANPETCRRPFRTRSPARLPWHSESSWLLP